MYAMVADRMEEERCRLFKGKLKCRTLLYNFWISAEIRYSCRFSARLFPFEEEIEDKAPKIIPFAVPVAELLVPPSTQRVFLRVACDNPFVFSLVPSRSLLAFPN